jgi:hypothetical protein
MAEETLALIAAEAGDRFGTDRIRVLHRIGPLRVGDVSTAIATATPHREEGFGASRYVIEEIKKRLPVWKLERYVEGDSEWVEGRIPPVTVSGEEPSSEDPHGIDSDGPSGAVVSGGPGSRKDPGEEADS